MRLRFLSILMVVLTTVDAKAADTPFAKGLPRDPNFFPIAVWLQAPSNAEKYKAVGINLYVGLWRGPSAEQLDTLDKAGIRLICHQDLKFKDRKTIVGWMHGDEPDNAQSQGRGKGYGPPILPSKIIEGYESIRKGDPDRPVLLNLGQGVAWDGYFGRGVRTNHPEDYAEYLKGCDIGSFDIYPASHEKAEIAGQLWYVAQGVDRLRKWSGGKEIWCCIETTGINNPKVRPTPSQVKSEVWLALIHGAKGLIYFSHQFQPRFIEAGLLADESMVTAVTDINRQIRELAPLLNSPSVEKAMTVVSARADIPIDHMVKRSGKATYVFAVAARAGKTSATFQLADSLDAQVEVIGESRTIKATGGKWADDFAEDFAVHLYRVVPLAGPR